MNYGYPYAQYQYDPVAGQRVEYVVPRYQVSQERYEFWNTVKPKRETLQPATVVIPQPIVSAAPVSSYLSPSYTVGSVPLASSQPLYRSSTVLESQPLPSLYRSSTILDPSPVLAPPSTIVSSYPLPQPYLASPVSSIPQYLSQPVMSQPLIPALPTYSRSYSPAPIIQKPRLSQEGDTTVC